MVGAQGCRPLQERCLEQAETFFTLAVGVVCHGQSLHAHQRIGMVRPQRRGALFQGLFKQFQALLTLSVGAVSLGKLVHAAQGVAVAGANLGLLLLETGLEQFQGAGNLAIPPVGAR